MDRVLEPEWLDELPASDARAAGSRAEAGSSTLRASAKWDVCMPARSA